MIAYSNCNIASNFETNWSLDNYCKYISRGIQLQLTDQIDKIIDESLSKSAEGDIKRDLSLYRDVKHYNTTCVKWMSSPIIGIRYKWVICDDYDLWTTWEAKVEHLHALLKFKTPKFFDWFVKNFSERKEC